MAQNDGQERTEEPTQKRLDEAREKGQIARSRELGIFAGLLAAAFAFIGAGEVLIAELVRLLAEALTFQRADIFNAGHMTVRFLDTVVEALLILAPFFLLMMLVGVLSAVVLGGWSFSTKAIAFKLEKLNPVKGLGRVFGWRGLVEMLKGLAKFLLVGLVTLLLLRLWSGSFLGLGGEPMPQALAHAGSLVTWSFLIITSVLVLVVLVDVPFQLWDHKRQLRMTKQEIKEEMKQTDGSPEVKGRQRRMQMEMAQRRMMEAIPEADVVITNPTHYAVALKYEQDDMAAPVVVAKGADLIAAQIRSIADEHGVPVLSTPPLARAIFFNAEVGDTIPEGLYHAVAQVLAYVYHLQQGAIYNEQGEDPLADLDIPDDLRRDE